MEKLGAEAAPSFTCIYWSIISRKREQSEVALHTVYRGKIKSTRSLVVALGISICRPGIWRNSNFLVI